MENHNCKKQKYVHEITGSTKIFRECDECHNHRFCTDSHKHEFQFAALIDSPIDFKC